MMDKKAIETISVSAVKASIAASPLLASYIADNDKEPSWDSRYGFLYDVFSEKDS